MKPQKQWCISLAVCLLLAVSGHSQTTVTKKDAGKLPDGSAVDVFTLKDKQLEVQITNYGGTIMSIKAPDRNGKVEDVVLGFDDPQAYYAHNHSSDASFLGPIVGRYANRIANATFTLDGQQYHLPKNNKMNSIHGGPNGFHNHVWKAKIVKNGIELQYLSKDGEEGYPGNLQATVVYTLVKGELKIDYSATTDKPTVYNPTNHAYFNLKGQGQGDVLQHVVKLNGSKFTPVDANIIPTGELRSVEGTPFDFRTPHAIGERIAADNDQIKLGNGYDHNYVIDNSGKSLMLVADVYEPASGRVFEVLTTEPGIQFYTGNFLNGNIKGKGGVPYNKNGGFALETQHYPDSPNHPDFPSTVLRPGQTFHSETVYRFSTR